MNALTKTFLILVIVLPLTAVGATKLRSCTYNLANHQATGVAVTGGPHIFLTSALTQAPTIDVIRIAMAKVVDGSDCVTVIDDSISHSTTLEASISVASAPPYLNEYICDHVTECRNVDFGQQQFVVWAASTDDQVPPISPTTTVWLRDIANSTNIQLFQASPSSIRDLALVGKNIVFVETNPIPGASQKIFPVSDVSTGTFEDTTGGDSDGFLFDEIDEDPANDTDYVRSAISGVGPDTFEVNLKPSATSTVLFSLEVRARKSASGGGRDIAMDVEIQNPDNSIICSINVGSLADEFTTYSTTCSPALVDDFTNMDANVSCTKSRSGGATRECDVTSIIMTLPANQSLAFYDFTGNLVEALPASGDVEGVAFDGFRLLVHSSTTNPTLDLYDTKERRIVATSSSPTFYRAIDFDGQHLWGVDDNDSIDQIDYHF